MQSLWCLFPQQEVIRLVKERPLWTAQPQTAHWCSPGRSAWGLVWGQQEDMKTSCLLTTSLPRLQGRWNLTWQKGFQHPAENSGLILSENTQSVITTRGSSGFLAENTNCLLRIGNFILETNLFNLTDWSIHETDSHLQSGLPHDTLLVGDALGKLYTELVSLDLRAQPSQVRQVIIPDFCAEQTFQPALWLWGPRQHDGQTKN